MASRGKHTPGTDGTDYGHRQRVVSVYTASAMAKHHLNRTFYVHLLLFVLLIAKLLLDHIGMLELLKLTQSPELPQWKLCEWAYGLSIMTTFVALRAIKSNSMLLIILYYSLTCAISLGPIVIAEISYLYTCVQYILNIENEQEISDGRFIFVIFVHQLFTIVALFVHLVQTMKAYELVKIWNSFGISKQSKSV